MSPRWIVLPLAFSLAGCPKKTPTDPLTGVWVDPSGGHYWVQSDGTGPRVVKAVDDDGEVLEVRSSGYVNGHFQWTYFVPSTSYTVTMEILSVTGSTAESAWRNDHGMSGTEELHRE